MRTPQKVSGIRTFKWNPQNLRGFRILFNTELAYEQFEVRAGIVIFRKEELNSKNLSIVSGIHEQNSKLCLFGIPLISNIGQYL